MARSSTSPALRLMSLEEEVDHPAPQSLSLVHFYNPWNPLSIENNFIRTGAYSATDPGILISEHYNVIFEILAWLS